MKIITALVFLAMAVTQAHAASPLGLNWGATWYRVGDSLLIDWGVQNPAGTPGAPLLPLGLPVRVYLETFNATGAVFRAKTAATSAENQLTQSQLGVPANNLYCAQSVFIVFEVPATEYREEIMMIRSPEYPIIDASRCGPVGN
jgi:hypothetical protein